MKYEDFSDYSFVLDIDGTLCPVKGRDERYEDVEPYPEMVGRLRYYKERGARIVLFTSRNMNTYGGNIGLINRHTARVLAAWLDRWQIPYDEIIYGKPWPGRRGFYVDDRTVRPDEFLRCPVDGLDRLCAESRCGAAGAPGAAGGGAVDVVITMGGLGSRFRRAGYAAPKYMIEARGRTLFEWSLDSLRGFYAEAARFIFIAMRDGAADVEGFVRGKCAELGLRNVDVLLLDYLTDGQATTALLARRFWNPGHGLLIYNIDTYVEPGAMGYPDVRGDGFIPCFAAAGTHWSFVKTDAGGRATAVREKERISDHCTLGAYYFRTCALYEQLYIDYYADSRHLVNGERYVAPLYNQLLAQGGDVYIADVPAERVHVLGTPEELAAFVRAGSGGQDVPGAAGRTDAAE